MKDELTHSPLYLCGQLTLDEQGTHSGNISIAVLSMYCKDKKDYKSPLTFTEYVSRTRVTIVTLLSKSRNNFFE